MGFGKMGKWNIANIPLENVVKSMHKKINPLKTNPAKDGIFDFPLFHHSIIPCVRQNHQPSINKHNFPATAG